MEVNYITILCIPDRDKYIDKFSQIKKQRDELYTDEDLMLKVRDMFASDKIKQSIKSRFIEYNMFDNTLFLGKMLK